MRLIVLFFGLLLFKIAPAQNQAQPNIVFILCDDLNEVGYGSLFDPSAVTPTIDSLVNAGNVFTNAHCNAPLCGPSRASLFTGILPMNSGHFGRNMASEEWNENPILAEATTIFRQMKDSGYSVFASGKVFHKNRNPIEDFHDFNADPFQGPYGFNKQSHSDLPSSFSDLNISYAALENIPISEGQEGWFNGDNLFFFENDENRDLLGDEISVHYADSIFQTYANGANSNPFFMTLGFYKPHQPFHAPQRFFDLYPLDEIDVSPYELENITYPAASFANRMNSKSNQQINDLIAASPEEDKLLELKKFKQGYYACVSLVDELVKEVINSLKANGLADNTYIIFSSDHGYHLGDKKIIKKSSLWNGSTKIPLVICGPSLQNKFVHAPASLIDIYPTILELTGIPPPNSHTLDGRNLLALNNSSNSEAIVSASNITRIPNGTIAKSNRQHFALYFQNVKYILYSSGEDELYNAFSDPMELNDLSANTDFQQVRRIAHSRLSEHIDSLRSPARGYRKLFFGDFEHEVNGWFPTEIEGISFPSFSESFNTRHLQIENSSAAIIETRNIAFDDESEHQLRLEGYSGQGSATIRIQLKSSIEEGNITLLDQTVNLNSAISSLVIPFNTIVPDGVQKNSLKIKVISGGDVHLDNIEIVRLNAEAEAKNFCLNSYLIPVNEDFDNLAEVQLRSLRDQAETSCSDLSAIVQQEWFSFISSTKYSLVIAETPSEGNPVIQIGEGCPDNEGSLICFDQSLGKTEYALLETEPGQNYIARILNRKKLINSSIDARVTHQALEELVPSFSENNLNTNILQNPNFEYGPVYFRFVPDEPTESASVFSQVYSPSGSYDMNLFDLEEGHYSVQISYMIDFFDITIPYGSGENFYVDVDGNINANLSNGIFVTPNPIPPGSNLISIQSISNELGVLKNGVLQDITGKILASYPQITEASSLVIPSNLDSGIYFLRITDAQNRHAVLKVKI
ncbi:MAG: sulfatase-like hydrolase/transferase [Bacteroidota bacterium]